MQPRECHVVGMLPTPVHYVGGDLLGKEHAQIAIPRDRRNELPVLCEVGHERGEVGFGGPVGHRRPAVDVRWIVRVDGQKDIVRRVRQGVDFAIVPGDMLPADVLATGKHHPDLCW